MFDPIYTFWLEVIYKPIFNLVIFTYNITPGPSFGLAVIGLAIFIRFVFLYFTLLGFKHDQQLSSVRPAIDKVEKDKTLTSREKIEKVSSITKPIGINPFLSSLPLFAQIIFLGVLYRIIQGGIDPEGFANLYSFVSKPEFINMQFFGFDLANPSILLAAAAGAFLLIERIWEYNQKKDTDGSFAQKWDPLIWPAGTFIILLILPSAKAIFLMTSVTFSFIIKSIVNTGRPKTASSTRN